MPRLPALDTIGGGLVTPAGMVIDARGRFKGLGTLATEGAMPYVGGGGRGYAAAIQPGKVRGSTQSKKPGSIKGPANKNMNPETQAAWDIYMRANPRAVQDAVKSLPKKQQEKFLKTLLEP